VWISEEIEEAFEPYNTFPGCDLMYVRAESQGHGQIHPKKVLATH